MTKNRSCLALVLLFSIGLHPVLADDQTTHAADMAKALTAMLGAGDPATLTADMQLIESAFQSRPDIADLAPAAFVQSAHLAVTASHPASRGAFHDIARNILVTGADMTHADYDLSPIALLDSQDPMVHELSPGVGVSESDITAFDSLRNIARDAGLDVGTGTARQIVDTYWNDHQTKPVDLMIAGLLGAWSQGAVAAWPELSAVERAQVAAPIQPGETPSPEAYRKVIGTDAIILWLGAVDIAMTDAERADSPELTRLMDMAAFAGPLRDDIIRLTAMPIIGLDAATEQLRRQNEWGAITGETGGWEGHRYMSQDR
ncbi:MAG: hypothetical protein DI498_03410 [Paracoccus denitrificans]|nr:MAG: hypothetical protein DI498_03410 [Paracoccus denitrificans]PZO85575.1 MAG: hypothetical protein DI633_03410 [Paracoccus denitrificans]